MPALSLQQPNEAYITLVILVTHVNQLYDGLRQSLPPLIFLSLCFSSETYNSTHQSFLVKVGCSLSTLIKQSPKLSAYTIRRYSCVYKIYALLCKTSVV